LAEASVETPKPTRKSRRDLFSKQIRILKIAFPLAKRNSFNDDLNIKKTDGSFNVKSNLAQLLNLTQTNVKLNPGLEDLIHQLREANVNPELITNEIIKSKLGKQTSEISTQTDEEMDIRETYDKATETELKSNIDKSISTEPVADESTVNFESADKSTSTEPVSSTSTGTAGHETADKNTGTDINLTSDKTDTGRFNTENKYTETDAPEEPLWENINHFNQSSNTEPVSTVDVAVGPDVGTRLTRGKKRPAPAPLLFDEPEDKKPRSLEPGDSWQIP